MSAPAFPQSTTDRTVELAELLERITGRVMAGETVDAAELARDHPEIADELRDLLPAVRLMADLGRPQCPGEGFEKELGDFRILREVGRGGMGVVYEAIQISENRRVALKVLPFAAALDARQFQRFQHEAASAALLHHPHIVPVYAVGCERGVPYYAMQFIDGPSLADTIADRRNSVLNQSHFEWVARLGVQAADALQYAHQLGVIHRDIKPANLLLDKSGELWVADFGLARSRVESGLTGTGDVVGTLRYMAPEQALAKQILVDHRCDIYSLGTTLYEALTSRPAFPGGDRDDVLRHIANGDFQPPSRLIAALAVDLETIILKAMALEPSHRYANAQDLADDLRRFLDKKAILARRPSIAERSLRWAGRHRKTVAAGFFALLVVAGLSTAIAGVIWHEKTQAAEALAQARAQSRRAEEHFVQALDGTTRLLTRLEAPAWNQLPGIDQLRGDGLAFFRQFVHADSSDPTVRFESSRACQRMALVYCSQQDGAHAQDMLRLEFTLLDGLADEFPSDAVYRRESAAAHCLMGVLYKSLKQPDAAHQELAIAAERYRAAAALQPTGDLLNRCAWFLADCPDPSLRSPAEATAFAERAVADDPANGNRWNTLGVARFRTGNWSAAKIAFEKSVELRQGGNPYDWFFLAMIDGQQGRRDSGLAWFRRSVDWMQTHPPDSEELLRYRAEAEQLFGERSQPEANR